MDFKFNKKRIIILLVFLFLVVVSSILYTYRYPKKVEENATSKVTLLNNYSRFFTVSNAANSYINYLAKKDTDALLLLLSEDYKKQQNINKNNIFIKLDELNGTYTFGARKIYHEALSKTLVKYYIYGYLTEDILDQYPENKDYYLIIIMDTKNLTYSVIPDNGKGFKRVDNGKV